MLRYVVMHELRRNILSLRLHIALILSLVVFSVGTVAFVAHYRASREEHERYRTEFSETQRELAESNLSRFAVSRKQFILEPRTNAFIDDSREKYLPGSFQYSAYDVFGSEVRTGSVNPYLQSFQELNWMFIVSVIISFTVFLFTFDTISGEKESRMLAYTLSNPVSRGTLMVGKYLSTIITTLLILLPGICASLVILLITGTVSITPTMTGEIAGFVLGVILFSACTAAFGMLSSVVARTANVSLLVALTFWIVFVAIVPNTALFWADILFPIEKAETVIEHIQREREEINANAPEGSWGSSGSSPFLPQHELRAANQTRLMNSESRIRNAYISDMYRQLKQSRKMTLLSPISLLEYMCEAIVGGGFERVQKNWNDLNTFQEQFLTFFKEKDANDPDSPHWYNPYEDYSTTKKPVNFEEVPLYRERSIPIAERFAHAGIYALVMLLYTAVIFLVTFVLFIRYDVR